MSDDAIAIILNYNGRETLPECIKSLKGLDGGAPAILVVDNASTDGSHLEIARSFPDVQVMALPENTGYCRGNNAGIEAALQKGASFLWLLNNDVVVEKKALQALLQAAEDTPAAGALGGKEYLYGSDRTLLSAGNNIDLNYILPVSRGRGTADEGQFDAPETVDYISGCSMLLRAEAIRQAGVFDDRFHFYWEDVDLCLRIKKAGWQVWHIPQSAVWHHGSHSFGPTRSLRAAYYGKRNRLLAAKKHNLGSKSLLRRTTRKLLINEYLMARKGGHPAPGKQLIASLAGTVDFYRGKFGPGPKWLEG